MASYEYFACLDERALPGVGNKIRQTVLALNTSGENAHATIQVPSTLGYFYFARKVALSSADVIIVRIHPYIMPLIFFSFALLRLRGKQVVVDVPTPCSTALREIRGNHDLSWLGKILRIVLLCIAVPWTLFPVQRVIQYAPESRYFLFGIKNNTILSANGIDVGSLTLRIVQPEWPTTEFVMVAVASLADWHGFDLVLKGMAACVDSGEVSIRLIIVGEGEVKKDLECLVLELGLTDFVEFTGMLTGAPLDLVFERAHVAVSSLAIFRKGLCYASSLKSREYVARGVPFIGAGYDPDFDPSPSFVYQKDNIDEPLDLWKVMTWYTDLRNGGLMPESLRSYADTYLDLSKKVGVFHFQESFR